MIETLALAQKYAQALYSVAKDKGNQDQVLGELRVLSEAVQKAPDVGVFLASPINSAEEKSKVVRAGVENRGMSETTMSFVQVLGQKNRLSLLSEIAQAFEAVSDEANGIVRGLVRSASALGPEARKALEEKISRATKKKVLLDYKEDPALIGGLVAQVGSYSFDDTLETQLSLMKEDLKRRSH